MHQCDEWLARLAEKRFREFSCNNREYIKNMKQEKRNFKVNKAFVSFETSRSTMYV